MRISEILESYDLDVGEDHVPSEKECHAKPRNDLSAYRKSQCIAQGYLTRKSEKGRSVKVGGKQVKLDGKKLKSEKFGGPVKKNS